MKRLCALLLAALLTLSACSGPGIAGGDDSGTGSSSPPDAASASSDPSGVTSAPVPAPAQLADLVLQEAAPLTMPQRPVLRMDFTEEEWEAYDLAMQDYLAQYQALRGEPLETTDYDALLSFSAASAPLALGGTQTANGIFSPISLWTALAMLGQCASGESRNQVLSALGVEDSAALADLAGRLYRRLAADDGENSLVLSGSLWLNESFRSACSQETLDLLTDHHFADLYCAPMGTEETDQAISAWISRQTRGLLGEDGSQTQTSPETLLMLLSSLFYKAAWSSSFLPSLTEQDTFTAADGTKQQVDFLHCGERGSALPGDGWLASSRSLNLGNMIFVLPDEGTDPGLLLEDPDFLPSLLQGISSDAQTRPGIVRWSLPRFDLSSHLDLLDTLAQLGIQDLPDPERADLSALSSLPSWVDSVLQMSRVQVDEEGVEAAAVTQISEATSARPEEPPEVFEMNLNRPFLFVLETDGLPLFVGLVRTLS